MAGVPPSPSQRILDAAEDALRRYGAEKTNVTDVARMLGMSHANIYRHFPSKKALLDAVAVRWLQGIDAPLEIIAGQSGRPAAERLVAWFDALRLAKRRKVLEDPELFRVYCHITENAHEVVATHVAGMLGQLERIIGAGVETGDFAAGLEAGTAARAVLMATVLFHHPAMVTQTPAPTEEDAREVIGLVLSGLRSGSLR